MTKKDATERDEHLSRLLAAAREAGGFDSSMRFTPAASALIEELYACALPVLLSMLKDGRIVSAGPITMPIELNEEDLGLLRVSADDRLDLALDMIVQALKPFIEHVTTTTRWDSATSSLSTYFINRCLMCKKTVLKKWSEDRSHRQHRVPSQDPDSTVEPWEKLTWNNDEEFDRHIILDLLGSAPPDIRPILRALAAGFATEDAAREMRISATAARTRLYRYRQHVVTAKVADLPLTALPQGYALTRYLQQLHGTTN
ncbi:hypothetical protein HG717_32380 [Rhodococcus erythropolis]|uniref:hypothetical protein n=1 Tax=Rhodococcus erythropolis TaxID=1833 RepID=UPI001C9A9F8A|nr:hypothetical protein [Rhodococcus erythropolis]MBY6388581.1 hypothetical protein [Rhodococcus erythropolis]